MRRADIEVPNLPVAMNAWGRSACYPQSTFYPLSNGRSTLCRGITNPTFVPARRVRLAVKPPYAFALCARLPTALRGPLDASVTFWEATAPVKLTIRHGPGPRSGASVRSQAGQGWYFNGGSARTGVRASKPPTYPTHAGPKTNVKIQ